MKNVYLKQDDYSDIDRIEEYNNEYISMYPDFKPFATRDNFKEFLNEVEKTKNGINNNGIKEIYYFAIEDDKIVGHGSIRLNPEVDNEVLLYCGYIMYGVVPSKRRQGYGTLILKLLLEEAKKYGLKNVIITCAVDNLGSNKIIINNNGEFIETIKSNENILTNRYNIKL